MLLEDKNCARGSLRIELIKPNGEVQTTLIDNLIVSVGLNYIVNRMKDASVNVMSHVAVGSGTVEPVAGNTALGAEISRALLTSTVVNDNQIVYAVTFAPGVGTGAITEAGAFNASTEGVMLARTVFPVINKPGPDTMSITWTVTLNDATV